jgi:hypothetical protein
VIKRISLLITAALMAAMMMVATAAPGFAVSPSEQDCLDAGGTFDRQQGQVSCVIVTEEEGKNPKFTEETTTTTTGQGNAGNKPTKDAATECQRPGAAEDCPPGQFK